MKKNILLGLIKYNTKQVYSSNGPWVISDGAPVATTANYAWGLVKSNPLLFLLAFWFFPKTLIVLLVLDYCYSSKPALVSYYNFCSAVVWKLCCLAKMIWHSAQYVLCCISDKFVALSAKTQSKQGKVCMPIKPPEGVSQGLAAIGSGVIKGGASSSVSP
ncbi:hypothetical protein MMH89_04750 [Candidatus Comchoanobacter bicostacola]|uniref:Uncharacterized protein n=1 Tax=Candidatus Comchoanobacter bicostacola TaxID=2919598 RepID=A0ABY5DJN8_9GAMM|nr:hypothetical protein [Candidatus Comchoanobacter bicostacola]UTC24524.1 hypothetical protein MMH89_04750 [Candidatus Comchoanobacter bicostacola]